MKPSPAVKTARYRLHTVLDGFEGAKSGRRYTIPTPGALVEAPEGEFKALKSGRPEHGGQYSREGGTRTTSSASSKKSE